MDHTFNEMNDLRLEEDDLHADEEREVVRGCAMAPRVDPVLGAMMGGAEASVYDVQLSQPDFANNCNINQVFGKKQFPDKARGFEKTFAKQHPYKSLDCGDDSTTTGGENAKKEKEIVGGGDPAGENATLFENWCVPTRVLSDQKKKYGPFRPTVLRWKSLGKGDECSQPWTVANGLLQFLTNKCLSNLKWSFQDGLMEIRLCVIADVLPTEMIIDFYRGVSDDEWLVDFRRGKLTDQFAYAKIYHQIRKEIASWIGAARLQNPGSPEGSGTVEDDDEDNFDVEMVDEDELLIAANNALDLALESDLNQKIEGNMLVKSILKNGKLLEIAADPVNPIAENCDIAFTVMETLITLVSAPDATVKVAVLDLLSQLLNAELATCRETGSFVMAPLLFTPLERCNLFEAVAEFFLLEDDSKNISSAQRFFVQREACKVLNSLCACCLGGAVSDDDLEPTRDVLKRLVEPYVAMPQRLRQIVWQAYDSTVLSNNW